VLLTVQLNVFCISLSYVSYMVRVFHFMMTQSLYIYIYSEINIRTVERLLHWVGSYQPIRWKRMYRISDLQIKLFVLLLFYFCILNCVFVMLLTNCCVLRFVSVISMHLGVKSFVLSVAAHP